MIFRQVADDLKKKLKKENIQQRSKGSVHYIKQMVSNFLMIHNF